MVGDKVVHFGKVERYPIHLTKSRRDLLENECLLLYHSGIGEGAAAVLTNVADNYARDLDLRETFKKMNGCAYDIYQTMLCGDGSADWLRRLGDSFNKIRQAHIELHPSVTNQRMDDLIQAALSAGALGIRFSGAGGRGVLTVICEEGESSRISRAMTQVDTPYVSDESGHTYNEGHPIHLPGFTDHGAKAWFV